MSLNYNARIKMRKAPCQKFCEKTNSVFKRTKLVLNRWISKFLTKKWLSKLLRLKIIATLKFFK